MKGKVLFVAGAAVGYVLGARAGRKRYEQIKSAASKVWETPGIQRQVNQVQDFAARKIGDVPGAIIDGTKKLVMVVIGHRDAQPTRVEAPARTAPAETVAESGAATTGKAAKKPAAAAKKTPASKPAASTTSAAKKPADAAKKPADAAKKPAAKASGATKPPVGS